VAGPVTSVVIVDDNPGDARLVEWALAHEPGGGFVSEHVSRVASALERLARGGVQAVLLDLGLPDSRGMEGLARVREKAPEVAVVVLTGSEDPTLVRHALGAGAQDYQVKGMFPPGHLARVIGGAVRRQRLELALFAAEPPAAAQLLAAATDGTALVTPSGIPLASEEFFRLTGASRAEVAARPPWLTGLFVSAPGRTSAPPPAGTLVLERPDGRREVEYVVRRARPGGTGPVLVHVRSRGSSAPAPTTPAPADDPIDPEAFGQLTELAHGDDAFLETVLGAFLEETKRLVPQLEDAAARGDVATSADIAHRLKSSAAQVGAMAWSRRLAELEREAKAEHLEESLGLARRVGREYPPVAEAITARRGSPPARGAGGSGA
jgi:DNA-binding NarL/FixJ family response regulator/HPt (histidine-containing phosphotransfer) domain-containing protein